MRAPKLTRRHVLMGTGASLLAASGQVWAQSTPGFDGFGDFDREMDEFDREFNDFEREIDEEMAAFERAIELAYENFDVEVGNRWGQEAERPQASKFVGYQDDLDTKLSIDYDKGQITVETISPDISRQELIERLEGIITYSSDLIDATDELRKQIDTEIRKDRLNLAEPPRPEVIPKELTPLIDLSKKPVYVEEPIHIIPKPIPAPTVIRPDLERPQQGQRPRLQSNGPSPKAKNVVKKKVSLPFISNHTRLSAERIADPVRQFADRFSVSRSLVLSITKNESSFNPRAQSPIPAFGLMQLVPRSGGIDSFQFVYGRKKAPSADYLFDPVKNLELGAAYLHILDSRYLSRVSDPTSRLWCVISGYNTGAGNVARAFAGTNSVRKAAPMINRMRSEQVYEHLRASLPYDETRRYLYKVRRDLPLYQDWDHT